MTNKYILSLSCKDTHGIVSSVSGFLFEIGGFIIESAQFGDQFTDKFFLRAEFECKKSLEEINKKFESIAEKFSMYFSFSDKNHKPKVLVAVTAESHCLLNLIQKNQIGALDVEMVGVVSNRQDLKDITEKFGLSFHYFPMGEGKNIQERKIKKLFDDTSADLLILARYMQILSDDFCKSLKGRVINIHHSFLPGFKGAKPYHQAYDRGVKIIGATAHYVTKDLDEGPIIEQEVIRVNHSYSPNDLKISGQDIESRVLFNAVKWHVEKRVIINGNKTVIFK